MSDALIPVMAPVLKRVLAHPFLRGLADGTLEEAAFRFFVVQDAIYLRDYARALAVLGARAPDEATLLLFTRHAVDALEVERELHSELFQAFGIDAETALATEAAPACLAYTSYLLRVAHGGSFAEALGAIIPCYWIYGEVGRALLSGGSPRPLYRRWIEAYAEAGYGAVVEEVLGVADRIWPGLGEDERARMVDHVRQTSRYEWCFWDMAWRQERWPALG
ncbi:MAG: thiaminase II [Candidatus Dormibacteraeota bacterium]|nr:thiaminase II [Candidatus Dormibacteraeota bacterium]